MAKAWGTDGLIHPPDGGLHDHHAAPNSVTISSEGVVSIPPGSTHNLDISLPRSDYIKAYVQVHGPKAAVYVTPSSSGYEGWTLELTTSSGQAIAHGARGVGGLNQYNGSYSAFMGSTVLTDYVFDSLTGSQKYIAVQSGVIISNVLRLVMHNRFGGSAFLWIRGKARLM